MKEIVVQPKADKIFLKFLKFHSKVGFNIKSFCSNHSGRWFLKGGAQATSLPKIF